MSAPATPTFDGPLTLAIIGAGVAGRSLAAEAVRAGHRVLLEDVLPSRLRAALAEIPVDGMPGSLEFATEVESAVREADLAIDFVPDELESKLEIVSLLDRMAPPRTVLCIPTEALHIADLASCTYRADRCIGMQWAGDTVQLQAGPITSAASVAIAISFWQSLGRNVTVQHHDATQPVSF